MSAKYAIYLITILAVLLTSCKAPSNVFPAPASTNKPTYTLVPTNTSLPTSGSTPLAPTRPQKEIEAEELEIYETALQIIGVCPYDLVMDTTVNFCIERDDYAFLKQELPSLTENTWANFVSANSQNQPLGAAIRDNLQISLMSDAELSEIWASENSYASFSAKYPKANGIFYLSQIGFNDEVTQSLVMVGVYDIALAALSGYAYFVLLEYQSGKWVEIEKIIACNA